MATVTHTHIVGATVFHVDAVKGVREAVVRSILINIPQTGSPIITYDVAFTHVAEGTAKLAESTLYVDVDAALAAYRPIVLAP